MQVNGYDTLSPTDNTLYAVRRHVAAGFIDSNGTGATRGTGRFDDDRRFYLALPLKKHPWLAAGALTALNTSVQLYNRYLKHEDFAQTTMHTVHNNLRTGFVWDNDMFIMNMFAHPYHDNLYFNVARSNGMNF